jgi:hypothetical protein
VSLDGPLEEFIKIRGTAEDYRKVEQHLFELLDLRSKMASTTEITTSLTVCPPLTVMSPIVEKFLLKWHGEVDQIFLWQMTDFKEGIVLTCRQGLNKHLENRRICTQPFE